MTSTIKPAAGRLRRMLGAAFAVTAAGGAAVAVLGVPTAIAAPDPCEASEVAKTIGTVATNTGTYLDENPETNAALTAISQQQAGPASLAALKRYFDANPEVGEEMQELQRPLTNLSGRCQLPVTIPQVMGLMQAAQAPGAGLPAGLPGALPGAPSEAVPGANTPTAPSPVSAATPRTGPLPGPVTASHR